MNPYQVLGVSSNADDEAIKRAYRKAVKECHPDTHPNDKKAEERFKNVAEAYDILCNPEKRAHYKQNAEKKRQGKKAQTSSGKTETVNINPMDVTAMFEKYMGFGK